MRNRPALFYICGTKARLSLASAQENVGCSNKRLWEEGFKEVPMYQISCKDSWYFE